MYTIKKENIRPFDVDRCLIMEADGEYSPLPHAYIKDPLTGEDIKVRINLAMVRLLKEEQHRGGFVIVWSRSGWEWAEAVVEALSLRKYVNVVMSKPVVYFDDTPVEQWLKDRVFLDFDFVYKPTKGE